MERNDPLADRASPTDQPRTPRLPDLTTPPTSAQADRTEEFATYLEGAGLSNMVTCPKVYRQASAQRVLTLEYLDGVSLSNLEAVKQYFPEPEVALIASLNTWVGSVLQNDWCVAAQLVHATRRIRRNSPTPRPPLQVPRRRPRRQPARALRRTRRLH